AMQKKLVIFDCDGTLFDSQNAICASIERAFVALGLPAPARTEVLAIVGLSLPQAFAVLASGQPPSTLARLVELYRCGYAAERECESGVRDPLFAGIGAVVEALSEREDMILGIATGKSRRGVARLPAREGWRS